MTLAAPSRSDPASSPEVREGAGAGSARPRICFVGWADHVHLERWAGWFAGHGFDVAVVSVSGHGRYPPGVRQYRLGLEGRGSRSIQLKLRMLLWRIRPDVVHVHWAHFAVPVRRVWNGPLVVTAWGSDVYRREAFTDKEFHALGVALRAAQLVTCDSSDLAATIGTAFDVGPDRIDIIQWGVDADLFRPEGDNLRASLGLIGREVIYSARSFAPVYNQETVVAAFAEVRRRRPRAFLLMKRYGGDAAYFERIRKDISTRGLDHDVRILDAVTYDAMPALYRTADVAVSVPLSDAAPMSLLEAMAAGVPAVVCDLPSLREWVRDGETGCLVDPRRSAAVAAAILSLLEDPARRLNIAKAARTLVVEKGSQTAHMTAMAKHYRQLANPMVRGDAAAAARGTR